MIEINDLPKTAAEKKRFVIGSETGYKNRISDISEAIAKEKPTFLLISGATCSGKTTTANILSRDLKKRGYTAKIISIDDFFLDKDKMISENIDMESAAALDMECFYKCISDISALKKTELPVFDFVSGQRAAYKSYEPEKDDIIVFEGIQALYPQVTSLFPKNAAKTLFVGFSDDVSVNGTVFGSDEVRFYRRLVRDFKFRNSSVENTLKIWKNVVRNENENILPYFKSTDYFINTFFEYELFVIKDFLLNKIPYKTPSETELYEKTARKFAPLPEIRSSYVPSDSMFREFIGG